MYEDISPGVGSLRTPKETVFVLLFFFFLKNFNCVVKIL